MEELVDVLGRERLLLELLVYRLVELRQLLVAGEGRFLGWAAEEVERAVRSVQLCEMRRAVLISSYADSQGISDDHLILEALVALADEPWRTMLIDHGTELRSLSAEVDDNAAAIRRLSRVAVRTAESRIAGDLLDAVAVEPRP